LSVGRPSDDKQTEKKKEKENPKEACAAMHGIKER
jgi:hypothetical protein